MGLTLPIAKYLKRSRKQSVDTIALAIGLHVIMIIVHKHVPVSMNGEVIRRSAENATLTSNC